MNGSALLVGGGGGGGGVSTRGAGGGGRRKKGGAAFDNSDTRFAWKQFLRGMGDTGQGYSEDTGTGDYAPGDQEGQESRQAAGSCPGEV